MEKGFSHWLFEERNWVWILAIPMAAIIIPFIIYSNLTMDEDLSNRDRRDKMADTLDLELTKLELPEKTGINKHEKTSKQYLILISTRYRTELPKEDFRKALDSQLIRNGWVHYRAERDRGFITFSYCRGKIDASLTDEGWQGIWGDGGDYWTLSYSLGLRSTPLFGPDKIPESCKSTN